MTNTDTVNVRSVMPVWLHPMKMKLCEWEPPNGTTFVVMHHSTGLLDKWSIYISRWIKPLPDNEHCSHLLSSQETVVWTVNCTMPKKQWVWPRHAYLDVAEIVRDSPRTGQNAKAIRASGIWSHKTIVDLEEKFQDSEELPTLQNTDFRLIIVSMRLTELFEIKFKIAIMNFLHLF